MRIRLWTWWQGPEGLLPPGEETEINAAEGYELCAGGYAEVVRDRPMIYAVAPPAERAVVVSAPKPKPTRRTRRKARS